MELVKKKKKKSVRNFPHGQKFLNGSFSSGQEITFKNSGKCRVCFTVHNEFTVKMKSYFLEFPEVIHFFPMIHLTLLL